MHGRDYFSGRLMNQRIGPFQDLKMQNGGIVLAGDFHQPHNNNNNNTVSLQSLSSLDHIKSFASRCQQLLSPPHGTLTKANSYLNQDYLGVKNSSTLISHIGPTKPSQFIEERRWPPSEFISNTAKMETISRQSHHVPKPPTWTIDFIQTTSTTTRNNGQHEPKSHDFFNTKSPKFQPTFEMDQDRGYIEKEILPDLQLSLTQTLGNKNEKTQKKVDYDDNTDDTILLSLSLSHN
ncbi:hypothetical protein Leryth_010998 [Lithospermum erythrorhizon]|nr:hypothetical protein Leryth_010998 [Lithospermum erythrorhizon]